MNDHGPRRTRRTLYIEYYARARIRGLLGNCAVSAVMRRVRRGLRNHGTPRRTSKRSVYLVKIFIINLPSEKPCSERAKAVPRSPLAIDRGTRTRTFEVRRNHGDRLVRGVLRGGSKRWGGSPHSRFSLSIKIFTWGVWCFYER
jgi:hypothetical protein